jgi:hypothetical protein
MRTNDQQHDCSELVSNELPMQPNLEALFSAPIAALHRQTEIRANLSPRPSGWAGYLVL